jgi:hypothetical protein
LTWDEVYEEKKKENSEEEGSIESSTPCIPLIDAASRNLTTTPFQQFLTEELRSIRRELVSMNQRLDRIENKVDIIYEMAAEPRVLHALQSLGMSNIQGLSSEFYHFHEYREQLKSLVYRLNNDYHPHWIILQSIRRYFVASTNDGNKSNG